jgi:hypothetical protein
MQLHDVLLWCAIPCVSRDPFMSKAQQKDAELQDAASRVDSSSRGVRPQHGGMRWKVGLG